MQTLALSTDSDAVVDIHDLQALAGPRHRGTHRPMQPNSLAHRKESGGDTEGPYAVRPKNFRTARGAAGQFAPIAASDFHPPVRLSDVR